MDAGDGDNPVMTSGEVAGALAGLVVLLAAVAFMSWVAYRIWLLLR